ncbi:MAG: tRNA lysidine(34) synthetase TilS [Deltaproteobacteria bacterium]|nr:tRNA lysidine(34) synthetase TilS [Deltaproteobacteria bacterium]
MSKSLAENRDDPVESALRAAFEEGLWAPADHLLVAVSGGADSVALLHALAGARARLGEPRLSVVSVDHRLREGSEAEVETVRGHAAALGLDFHPARIDLAGAGPPGAAGGLQALARRLRREALEALRERVGANWIVSAHSATDQAETLLMRALHGTSVGGLASIRPRRGVWLRPLLACRREALRAYCEAHALAFHDDPGNEDPRFDRSALRHTLLPLLEERFNPRSVEALARLAGLAAEDDALLEAMAGELEAALRRGEALEAAGLAAAPRPLARRVLIRAWREAARREGLVEEGESVRTEAAFIDEILARVGGERRDPWERSLPGGLCAILRKGRLTFGRTPARP